MAFNDLYGGKYKSQFNLDTKNAILTGVTKDATGTMLAACLVRSFVSATKDYISQTTSDGSGAYIVSVPVAVTCFLVAYKAGSPDVAGTTVNTLVGTGGY